MDPLRRITSYKVGMKLLVPEKVETVPVTSVLVEEYCSWKATKHERKLSQSRMAYLIEAVQSVALPFQWYVARIGNVFYRINGQHTLELLSERPHLVKEGMYATIATFKCQDETELAIVYAAIDSRIISRSTRDINKSFSAGHPRLEEFSPTFINLCMTGIKLSERGLLNTKTPSVVEHGEMLLSNLDFMDFVHEIMPARTDKTQHICRAPVIYGMHKTYAVDTNASVKFWTLVRDGDVDRGSMPDMLRDYLVKTTLGPTGTRARSSGHMDSRATMAEKVIRVWNAWRTGKQFTKMPPTNDVIPEIV